MIQAPVGWARLQAHCATATNVAHGSLEELPFLALAWERGEILRQLVFLGVSAAAPQAAGSADKLSKAIGRIVHVVGPDDVAAEIRDRREVFEEWTRQDPFQVVPLRSPRELMEAAQRESRLRATWPIPAGLTDSMWEVP